jgi:hypothetical protein
VSHTWGFGSRREAVGWRSSCEVWAPQHYARAVALD